MIFKCFLVYIQNRFSKIDTDRKIFFKCRQINQCILNYIILVFSEANGNFRFKIIQADKDISKPSAAIASFHEMKFAVVAKLFEGQSPEFRSHRRINPWNSNRWRVCEVFACNMNYTYKLRFAVTRTSLNNKTAGEKINSTAVEPLTAQNFDLYQHMYQLKAI